MLSGDSDAPLFSLRSSWQLLQGFRDGLEREELSGFCQGKASVCLASCVTDPEVFSSASGAVLYPLTAALAQFWKEVVEDTEVRELIWDKSNAAQGNGIQGKLPLDAHSLTFRDRSGCCPRFCRWAVTCFRLFSRRWYVV